MQLQQRNKRKAVLVVVVAQTRPNIFHPTYDLSKCVRVSGVRVGETKVRAYYSDLFLFYYYYYY